MALSEPVFPLQNHCTVIYDNKLYAYSPDGLQTLPLQRSAVWSQEPSGVSVQGATCVLGHADGDRGRAALYVIGGTAIFSPTQYAGIQRFSFDDKSWSTIIPMTPVTQNRQHHGAAFLHAESAIVVYAGSQDGESLPSTQTFVIDTKPPYRVRSYTSNAPPAVDPSILLWDDHHVALVGGSPTNDQIFTFSADGGWKEVKVTLTQPPPHPSRAQNAMMSLDDGGKVLLTIDFSQAPNQVSRTIILNPGGQPAPAGKTVGDITEVSKQRRRNVLLSTIPSYNNTFVPATTRNGGSMAYDNSGLHVISGGDNQDPLAIFNASENRWLSTEDVLGSPAETTSSVSTTPTFSESVSIPTASSDEAVAVRTPPLTILGIVLGAVSGIAALLILALSLLRWKKRQKPDQARGGKSLFSKRSRCRRPSSEDQSLQPIKAAAQPMGNSGFRSNQLPGHVSQLHQRSRSEVQPQDTLQQTHYTNSGMEIISPFNHPQMYFKPIAQSHTAELSERFGTSRKSPSLDHDTIQPRSAHRNVDSGWSTYFSGDLATDAKQDHRPADSNIGETGMGARDTLRADDSKQAVQSRNIIPGLTDSHGNPLQKLNVHKASPQIGNTEGDMTDQGLLLSEGIPAQILRPESNDTSLSDERNLSHPGMGVDIAYSGSPSSDGHGRPETPGSLWSGPPNRLQRPPSSSYTNSFQVVGDTSTNQEHLRTSPTRPVTQWPHPSINFSDIQSHRPEVHSSSKNSSGAADVAAKRSRDAFGSNPRRELHRRDVSWLNLNSQVGSIEDRDQSDYD